MSGEKKSSFISQLNVFNKDNYTFGSTTKTTPIDNEQNDSSSDVETGQQFMTELDQGEKQLGLFSCIGLICNRMLGTGVFAVSSTIYTLCGSVGLSLIMWALGGVIALSGLYVYMEFGTAIPKNGGEKNYLEFIFKKPRFLVTSMYASYVFFLGWAAGNSVNTAVMFLTAADVEVTKWNQRGIAVAVIFFAFLINSVSVKTGIYIQNALGIFKIGIVIFISITGWVALGGGLKDGYQSHNFHNAFEGTETATAYGIVNALYNVIWSFVGYSNVNYALGEVKNPVRTLKIAGPTSLIFLAIIYIFVNIAYFAVVPKEKLISSKLVLAADFFDIVFGGHAKRAAAALVGLSALGNVLSVIFSQGRIIQQLAREGVLPFSNFFASSKPFNSPMVGLFQHFIICLITIIAPPPGDAYNFVLNLISYPMNIINFVISAGLLWTYWQKRQGKIEWNPPIRAGYVVTTFFTLVNLYLIVCPYIPPSNGESVYETLPYYIHCVVSWGIFAIGALYYLFWAQIMPKLRHYRLETKDVLGDDGFWKVKIIKVYDEKHESTNDEDDDSNSLEFSNSNNYSMTNIEQHLEYIESGKKSADSDTEMHVRAVDHQS
ncbi:similar to Saccharomyces cerevisiae YGR055W MUP1 High affinity methionine permease, integral membrane protein with 13 putative membrane-spanning regions [Maudiozyma saulgeensis]|uniref:Similar to Saccharomyces cerevisiae YGR055W MUP1 High affinity methionine permease, integral membrane protein with 13 putative membrane-spanning regions n=1 Tax=Maudiozyma saulgeensis TaxID=1789683 RepID=A0A1X7QZ45_9SACH|nr:similar to Saccharomyces cerevisiae YGR055W MUP1 High affinity methionine permease, integral membrane protein with 13 putative membrane-spanning regions [Kazachstania saulgeensis]